MPWPLLALAGLGMGGVKYAFDKKQEHKLNEMEAQKELYSPWTGLKGEMHHDANLVGDLMAGGATGAALGQSADQMDILKNRAKWAPTTLNVAGPIDARNLMAPWSQYRQGGGF
jgi:hypothetical protein